MNDRQLVFWRALLAPFADGDLSEKPGRGGKTFTFLDKRALSNRLDSVCGPHGWDIAYTPNQRGFTARMGILCPVGDADWAWIYKEDGGGFEEMDEIDNDEKSAYTNAFRRAGQDAWGIGRYLYRKGIPAFLDPGVRAVQPPPEGTPPRAEPRPAPASAVARAPVAEVPRKFEHGYMPEPGKGVYPWIKEVEKHFHDQFWVGIKQDAERLGLATVAADWKRDDVVSLVSNMIRYIKTLKQYKGEFDSVALTAETYQAPAKAAQPQQPEAVDASLAEARANLGRTVKVLVERQLGRPGTPADIIAVLENVASSSRNKGGHVGEVLTSLRSCDDAAWIANMTAYANDQLTKTLNLGLQAGSDQIPF